MGSKFLINIFYLSLAQFKTQAFFIFTYPFPVYVVAVLVISETVIVNKPVSFKRSAISVQLKHLISLVLSGKNHA